MNATRPGDASLALVVERLRLIGYSSFWVVVLTGVVLTRYFSDVDVDQAEMTRVFGYPNLCVYFDHPPSNRVLPFLWTVTLVFLLGYVAAQWLHMRADVHRRALRPGLFRTLTGLKLFEALTLIAFSTSFAVSPDGTAPTLWVHTVPFFLAQLGLVSLAMSNTLHGIGSGYWRRLGLPGWFTRGAVVYCALFALIVAFKIPYATNAMAGGPWWEQTESVVRVAAVVDVLFLVFAAIVPMLKATCLLIFRRGELDTLYVAPRIAPAAG